MTRRMSSPSSSSSGTAGARRSRLPSRSTAFTWSAAVVTSAALYGFPYALVAGIGGGGAWYLLLAFDLLVLAAVAVFLLSPLVVLAATVVSGIFGAIFWFIVAAADTCGDSGTATTVEFAGGMTIALAVGAWGVRRGPRALWAIPVGWVLAGLWIAIWAHVIPGGAG